MVLQDAESADSLASGLKKLSIPPKLRIEHKDMEKEMAVSPSARMLFSAAQDENGWVCGKNGNGQLGTGQTGGNVAEPQLLEGRLRWVALSQGELNSAGVDDQGKLYSWGSCKPGDSLEVRAS